MNLKVDPEKLPAISRYAVQDLITGRELYGVVSNNKRLIIFYRIDGSFDHLRRLSVIGDKRSF